MSPVAGVSGVSGWCRVDLANMTHVNATFLAGLRGSVSSVSGLRARARLSDIFYQLIGREKISYAKTNKPDKPDTPNTNILKALILKSFRCVGFVSGWMMVCRVQVFGGIEQ